ncbi:hypothetical protein [Deinococcus altitudinis]|uniref:hypothetical protein n=1 Tax=Deinococcus altitudinis TaxID=468914 RepID=UPI003891FEB2
MTRSAWATDSTLPVTSWRDGHLVYVSATPMPLTADQAQAAGERLIEHAKAIKAQTDPHASKVAALAQWKATHAAGECADCDPTPAPCICEIAEPLIGRAHGEAELAGLQ